MYKSERMENIHIANNAISGDIDVGGERILQISVPYNGGWTARIDGEAQEVFRCGGMYTGLRLSEGAHHVELRYCTPGLKAGAAISAISVILVVLLAIFTKRCKAIR